MNGYTDIKERSSFQIEILKCNSECASDSQIEEVLSAISFTMYLA